MRKKNISNQKNTVKFRNPVFCGRLVRTLAIILWVFLLVGESSFARETEIGLHGGLSIPNLRGGGNIQSEGYTSRKGPFYGLFADFPLTRRFSLRVEVNYCSQGGKRDGMQPLSADQVSGLPLPPGMILYANFRNKAIIDYLEIPLMIKCSWGDRLCFFIDAGPYVGFRVRAKTVTRGSSSLYIDATGTPLVIPPDNNPLPPVSFDADTPIAKDIHSLNVGVCGGAGIEKFLGPGKIILGVHFSVGFSNIQTDTELNGKNNTGAMVVYMGYSFLLKKGK